jgi:hypothetical protein
MRCRVGIAYRAAFAQAWTGYCSGIDGWVDMAWLVFSFDLVVADSLTYPWFAHADFIMSFMAFGSLLIFSVLLGKQEFSLMNEPVC